MRTLRGIAPLDILAATAVACTIGLALPAKAAGQAGGLLPDALQRHVEAERFDIVTSIRGLPLGVREELQRLWETRALEIAEPGAPFRSGRAAGDTSLPLRRLIAAGCSADFHCLVHYERGGREQAWVVALFRWTPAATQLEWGGTATGTLGTIEGVQKAVVSGRTRPGAAW